MTPQGPRKRKHGILRKVATVAAVSLFLLLLLELGLRLFGFSYTPQPSFQINFAAGSRIVQPHPDTIWTARPDTLVSYADFIEYIETRPLLKARHERMMATGMYDVLDTHVNNLGLHNVDNFRPKKPPGTFRVLCLGSSTTWGLSDNKNWTVVLREGLQALFDDGTKVQVLNAGVPAFSSTQILVRYRGELKDVEADVVILMGAWNDARLSRPSPDPEWIRRWKLHARRRQGLLYRARTVQLTNYLKDKWFPRTPPERGRRVPLPLYEQNIRELNKEVTGRNGRLLLCTEPSALRVIALEADQAKNWIHFGNTVQSQGAYNEKARSVAASLDIPVADAAEAFASLPESEMRRYFFEPEGDPIHPVVPGHRAIAACILKKLRASPGYLPSSASPAEE